MVGKDCGKKKGRDGFTLIELLVVVSIIALLIAILLPALGKAKVQANKTACGTRIRGLGTALASYLAEYDNRFPINGILMPKAKVPDIYTAAAPNRFTVAEVTDQQQWRLEYGALWSNMGGPSRSSYAPGTLPPMPTTLAKEFLCPSDTLNRTYGTTGAASNSPLLMQPGPAGTSKVALGPGQGGYWSYSINAILNSLGRFRNNFTEAPFNGTSLPWIDPFTVGEIQNPSNFLVFIEEDEASLFNDEVFDAPAFGGGDRITNRHNNGGNVGYGDYHVEWVSEVAFDAGQGNPVGVSPYVAMQSPWTRQFFPDGGQFANSPP